MPVDGALEIFGGLLFLRIERDFEDEVPAAIGLWHPLRRHLAEPGAEDNLLLVAQTDLREHERAKTLERFAAFSGERGIQDLLRPHDCSRTDAGRKGLKAAGHGVLSGDRGRKMVITNDVYYNRLALSPPGSSRMAPPGFLAHPRIQLRILLRPQRAMQAEPQHFAGEALRHLLALLRAPGMRPCPHGP